MWLGIHRQFQKLDDACAQAIRKKDAIAARPDVIAGALGISEARAKQLRPIPLVVHNQGFGFGLESNGCRITDERFLKNIMGSGLLSTDAAWQASTGAMATHTTTLYSNQQEAEANLENLLSNPAVLHRFVERIDWDLLPFPTSIGTVQIEVPLVGNIHGAQLLKAAELEKTLLS